MFHVLLVLPGLILAAVVLGAILICIIALIAGLVGGTTVAVFIKNKTVRDLLIIGFGIIVLLALALLLPLVSSIIGIPGMFVCIAGVIALSIIGMKRAGRLQNAIAKTILLIVFSLVLAAAIIVVVLTMAYFALMLFA